MTNACYSIHIVIFILLLIVVLYHICTHILCTLSSCIYVYVDVTIPTSKSDLPLMTHGMYFNNSNNNVKENASAFNLRNNYTMGVYSSSETNK
jgi:hypothetical protein